MMIKRLKRWWQYLFMVCFVVFVGISLIVGSAKGVQAGQAFVKVIVSMLRMLPFAFILIALIEVWLDRETVIRHLGTESGMRGYLWAIALGGMTIGGVFVAFPLAYTLFRKGASLRVIFCFLGFAGVCRIPMTIFEISYLGLPFTLIRLACGIGMLMLAGILLGGWLEKQGYEIREP